MSASASNIQNKRLLEIKILRGSFISATAVLYWVDLHIHVSLI